MGSICCTSLTLFFCTTWITPESLLPEPVALGKTSASLGLWGGELSRVSLSAGGAGRAQGLRFPVLCPASPISSGSAVLCPKESPRFERRKKKIRFPRSTWLRMRMPKQGMGWRGCWGKRLCLRTCSLQSAGA